MKKPANDRLPTPAPLMPYNPRPKTPVLAVFSPTTPNPVAAELEAHRPTFEPFEALPTIDVVRPPRVPRYPVLTVTFPSAFKYPVVLTLPAVIATNKVQISSLFFAPGGTVGYAVGQFGAADAVGTAVLDRGVAGHAVN